MARLRRILEKGETVTQHLPTGQDRAQRLLLWGVGLPVLALELPYLFGLGYPDMSAFRLAILFLAGSGLILMLLQYWRSRPRIAITDRRILVRRGITWRRHAAMALRDVTGFQYDAPSKTLTLYGEGRLLTIPCDPRGRARIVMAVGDAA